MFKYPVNIFKVDGTMCQQSILKWLVLKVACTTYLHILQTFKIIAKIIFKVEYMTMRVNWMNLTMLSVSSQIHNRTHYMSSLTSSTNTGD